MSDSRDDRIARLTEARRADSTAKREAVLASLAELTNGDETTVTIAEVARRAKVSTWFIYNSPDLRRAVHAARIPTSQTKAPSGRTAATVQSLRTDLAIARSEISDLRSERDALAHRIQLILGKSVEQVPNEQLAERIRDQDELISKLSAQLDAERLRADRAESQLSTAQDDLVAARSTLKKMMRSPVA